MEELYRNGGPPPIREHAAPDFWDRLYVIRRRWAVLLLCLAAGTAVGYYLTRGLVPEYQAEATVQRRLERSPLDAVAMTGPGDMISEMEIIRSASVLGRVVDSVGVDVVSASNRDEAVRKLRRDVTLAQVPGTNLIRISYTSESRQRAADVVNLITHDYIDFSARKAGEDATRRREFIATQLAQVADSMRGAQQTLAAYQAASGTLDPSEKGGAIATALMAAETEQRTLRFQESVLQSLTAGLSANGRSDEVLRRVVVMGRDIVPSLDGLYTKLQQFETERSRLTASRFGQTREGPNVQVLDSLIETAKDDIRAMTEQSLNAIRTRLHAVDARVVELRIEQGGLPGQASEYARLRQRTDAAQQTFDQLATKLYEAQIAEAVEGGKVVIVDPAVVPRQPVSSKAPRIFILAMVLGMAAGLLIAFLLEFIDRKVRTPADAERFTSLRMIGAIPDLRSMRHSATGLVMLSDQASPASEAFRMLRTTLKFATAEKTKVMALTSAAPGEGKSLIACNLAIALARQGAKVLLIDADLRRPSVHTLFEVPQSPGVTDVLAGAVPIEKAVRQIGSHSLRILVCGTAVPNPAELLGSGRFGDLLNVSKARFDYVIVDTPPVLAVTDAAAITNAVDGIIVIARADRTDRLALRHTVMQLQQAGAPVLGYVLNCISKLGARRYGADYGYYGFTYTHYYKDSKQNLSEAAHRLTHEL